MEKSRPTAPSCRSNLQMLIEAKRAWAEEKHKTTSDFPIDADLFGPTSYLRVKPKCAAGSIYTIGSIAEKPRCSIPGHTI